MESVPLETEKRKLTINSHYLFIRTHHDDDTVVCFFDASTKALCLRQKHICAAENNSCVRRECLAQARLEKNFIVADGRGKMKL